RSEPDERRRVGVEIGAPRRRLSAGLELQVELQAVAGSIEPRRGLQGLARIGLQPGRAGEPHAGEAAFVQPQRGVAAQLIESVERAGLYLYFGLRSGLRLRLGSCLVRSRRQRQVPVACGVEAMRRAPPRRVGAVG